MSKELLQKAVSFIGNGIEDEQQRNIAASFAAGFYKHMIKNQKENKISIEKRFFIENGEIKSYEFFSNYPKSDGYIVVLDMFKKPQRITKILWESLPYLTYSDAKIGMINTLKTDLKFWEESK